MNTYDDLVNDYLHAVEQALAGVPANRRAELLADLSEHISAKRAEIAPGEETEVEVRSILELLGDPDEVAAEARLDDPHSAPILIEPKKKSAALIWVIITIAAVASLCVVVGVLGAAFLAFRGGDGTSGGGPAPLPEASVIAPTPSSS
ncbi:HAAS signaling domain-containing protein [Dactylosporangium sp. McL0621]|uniref:HAAS signaling domain-containing protein n=1 Tax=Dactylosporangium sp. McL0621 TaxID=3415678 RepID=UPI003CF52F50